MSSSKRLIKISVVGIVMDTDKTMDESKNRRTKSLFVFRFCDTIVLTETLAPRVDIVAKLVIKPRI
ncbi:hypothetical protein D3C80_1770040 [compost metagenome]